MSPRAACDECRVTVLECGFEIGDDVLVGLQVMCWIPRMRRCRCHVSFLLQPSREISRPRDVPLLAALVTAGEQYHQSRSAPHEVHAVARSLVNALLRDARTNRPDVPGVAKRQSPNAQVDARPRPSISQPAEPARIHIGLANLDQHRPSVSFGILEGNRVYTESDRPYLCCRAVALRRALLVMFWGILGPKQPRSRQLLPGNLG